MDNRCFSLDGRNMISTNVGFFTYLDINDLIVLLIPSGLKLNIPWGFGVANIKYTRSCRFVVGMVSRKVRNWRTENHRIYYYMSFIF